MILLSARVKSICLHAQLQDRPPLEPLWPEVGVSLVRVAVRVGGTLPQELPKQGQHLQLCCEFLGAPCLPNPTKLTEAMETTNFNSASDMPYL